MGEGWGFWGCTHRVLQLQCLCIVSLCSSKSSYDGKAPPFDHSLCMFVEAGGQVGLCWAAPSYSGSVWHACEKRTFSPWENHSVSLPVREGSSVAIHPCPLRLGEDNVTSLCPFNPFLLAHYYFIILIFPLLKIKDTMGGIHEWLLLFIDPGLFEHFFPSDSWATFPYSKSSS